MVFTLAKSPMKHLALLFIVGGLLAGDLSAQQSSRRTRDIQPRQSADQTQAAVDQLQKQAALAESQAPVAQTVQEESPFRPASQPPTSETKQGIRVAGDEFEIQTTTPTTPAMANQAPPTPRQSLTQQSPLRQDAKAEPVASSRPQDKVIDGGKSISTRISANSEINVGQPASLSLIAQNNARENLDGVNLTVHLSEHVEFLNADPQPTDRTESMAVWRLPAMAAGQQSEIKLQVIPYSKEEMTIETEFAIIDSNKINIAVRQPDVKMAVTSVDKAIVGQKVAHQVKIWNEGDGTATDLKINLGLSSDMRLLDSNGDTVELGMLKPGETREFTLETLSSESGEAPIVYQLAGPGVNVEQVSNINIVIPELYAEILGPKVNIPNREGSYTINVKNPGVVDINDAKIVLQVPGGMEVTLLSRAGDFDEKAGTISWDLGKIAPNGSDVLQFKARLTSNNDQQCFVTVESRETKANQLAFETRAFVHTELKLAMKNLTGPVNVGESAEFVVVASNTGFTPANGVEVQVEIPEWITPAEDKAYRIDTANSRLIFDPVNVPKGMAAELKFKGVCNSAGNFVVRSVLTHASQEQPMISDAGLFVLDTQTEKVGSVLSTNKNR